MLLRSPLLSLIALTVAGCPSLAPDFGGGATGGDDDDSASGLQGLPCGDESACFDGSWYQCLDGAWDAAEVCEPPTPLCLDAVGCLSCPPDTRQCQGDEVVECSADGLTLDVVDTCEPSELCQGDTCVDRCDEQLLGDSHLGCHFLAAPLPIAQSSAEGPSLDLVVANPSDNAATHIEVWRGLENLLSTALAPGAGGEWPLPVSPELSWPASSLRAEGEAFEIVASAPVAAWLISGDGGLGPDVGSAAASLLLPERVLAQDYLSLGLPGWAAAVPGSGAWKFFYGPYLAVLPTGDGTTVELTLAGRVDPGLDGGEEAGDVVVEVLDRGDLLLARGLTPHSNLSADYCAQNGWLPGENEDCEGWETCRVCSVTEGDLSGTAVRADGPVAVFTGHEAVQVPYERGGVDALHNQEPPPSRWGTHFAVPAPPGPLGLSPTMARYRVLATTDATSYSLQPPVAPPGTLDAGQVLELDTDADFLLNTTAPVQVLQLRWGVGPTAAPGDAAGRHVPPLDATASGHQLYVPGGLDAAVLTIVADEDAGVTVDGHDVTAWVELGGGWRRAWRLVGEGAHEVRSVGGGAIVSLDGLREHAAWSVLAGWHQPRL